MGGGEQEQVDSMLVMSGGEGYIDFRLGRALLLRYDIIPNLLHMSQF